MVMFKYADIQFGIDKIHDTDKALYNNVVRDRLLDPKNADIDDSIRDKFVKFAHGLKKVSPKANDFLYFSCIIMHSGEASLINQKTGEIIKDTSGKPIEAEWEINKKTGSWKWKCSDINIKPYKNNNGDIFPESELKKAYKKWIGRPLCKDHQSSSVDGIRGIIIDTYYDEKFKRVIALCALDKINYPDLSRKVATGYATDVSMGTGVGRSICYNCGNIAKVERDYCSCIKNKTAYGEINLDLSPIELSLVVTGADPKAKLRNIIASLSRYSDEKKDRIDELKKAGCVTVGELDRLEKEINDLKSIVNSFIKNASIAPGEHIELRNLIESLEKTTDPKVKEAIQTRINEISKDTVEVEPTRMTGGGGFREEPSPAPYQIPEDFDTRFANDSNIKLEINAINKKLDAMGYALRDLSKGIQSNNNKEEQFMTDKLQERAAARRAQIKKGYFQGGGGINEPQVYPKDPMNEDLRTDGDKQMEGQGMESGKDGLHPGYQSYGNEEELKKRLLRAELEERKLRRQALLAKGEDQIFTDSKGNSYKKDMTGKIEPLKPQTAEDDLGNMSDEELDAKIEEFLQRKAYFQGGGGVNEPQVYPKDSMNEDLRTDGDKQMEGQGMESGKDGLHPGYQSYGNEEELKKRLLRANEKLRAKFVMAFKNEDKTVIDKENSRWEVYAGSNKILEATGREIFEEKLEENWSSLASKRYGREVLRAIREKGLKKVTWLLKGDTLTKTAQPPMGPAGGGLGMGPAGGGLGMGPAGGGLGMGEPPMGEPPMGEPPMGEPPMGEPPMDEEQEGNAKSPVEQALDGLTEHIEEAEKVLGDLKDALQETTGETEAELPSPAEANDDEEQMADDIQDTFHAIDESADELAMLAESIESRVKSGKNEKDVITAELLRLSKEAICENEKLCKEASLIIESKKKKDEEDEDKKEKKGKKGKKDEEEDEDKKEKKGKKGKKDEEEDEDKKRKKGKKDEDEDEDKKGKKSKAELMLENLLKTRATKRREILRFAKEEEEEEEAKDITKEVIEEIEKQLGIKFEDLKKILKEEKEEPEHQAEDEMFEVDDEEVDEMDINDQLAQLLDDSEDETGEVEGIDTWDDNDYDVDDKEVTAEERRAWRAKVAAEVGAKYQLKLDPASTIDTNLPINDSAKVGDINNSEAVIEGIVEQHEEIMRQVQNLPKVREAMNYLGNLLKSGKLKISDLENKEKLNSLAVDPEAAKYWKDYFGEGDEVSKQFGQDLTKEFTDKKKEASLDETKAKMRRAYDIALEMQEKGMISSDASTLHSQVDEIMKFDNAAFESYKRALSRVSKSPKIKNASPAIQVGVGDEETVNNDRVDNTLANQLKKLW